MKILRWVFAGWTLLWVLLFVRASWTTAASGDADVAIGTNIIFFFFFCFFVWLVGAVVMYFVRRMVFE